jgi:ribosome biogenesis GTPase
MEKSSPLVGDNVIVSVNDDGSGNVDEILQRTNEFIRPPVANIDIMVIVAANVNPVTVPFLIDRIAALASYNNCEPVICVNKCDMDRGDRLFDMYRKAGYRTVRTSAVTGEGIDELKDMLKGKLAAFTGNSGVGKSSILNAIDPEFNIRVGEVSDKLGRGRHTTRHVEIYELPWGGRIIDTPGFAFFDTEMMNMTDEKRIQYLFPEFEPYLGTCRFDDCAHVKERGCSVLEAVEAGVIDESRHRSYVELYNQAKAIKDWMK